MGKKKDDKKKSFSLKKEVGYWSALASSIATLVSVPFLETIPTWAKLSWLIITGAIIIILAIKMMVFITKSIPTRKELEEHYKEKMQESLQECHNQYKECSEEIHKYFHNMRDNICSCSLADTTDERYVEHILRNVCSDIESIFSILWNKKEKVSVCIKKIVLEEDMNDDYKNWKVETIARSSGTKQSRNNDNRKPVAITENSDFLIIVSPKYADSVFSCMDLTKVKEKFSEEYNEVYRNSTKNYLKYYKSTIVVPIRIEVDKMNPEYRKSWMDGIYYHLVGFLCIDTEKSFSGTVTQFDSGIELAKAVADILYNFIENNFTKKASKKENNTDVRIAVNG